MNQPCDSGAGGILGPRPRGGRDRLPSLLAAAALALTAVGAATQPALAYGPTVACSARTEVTPFAPWGDSAAYFLVPNGGFEDGSQNWALAGGAGVITVNQTYNVAGTVGSRSLLLPPGSSAESRTFCVSVGEDVVRLFVNNPHVPGAILHVEAVVRNPVSGAVGYAAFDVNGDVPSESWAPTMRLAIPRLFDGTSTQELTLFFTLRGTRATWGIDDVYVDPFKSW